ncbi:hypothetical protein HY032_03240, partial [Candidatus Gottesmanbacteria bacterium]|nr:hypothetical protein [Candidatus Gottesmanbacteria bacterium]
GVTSPEVADAPPASQGSAFQQALSVYLRAGYPLIYVVTAEEERAIDLIVRAVSEGDLARRTPFVRSVSRGLCTTAMKAVDRSTADPKKILPFLLDSRDPAVFCPLLAKYNISYITVEDTKGDPNLPEIDTEYFNRFSPAFTDEQSGLQIFPTSALCALET